MGDEPIVVGAKDEATRVLASVEQHLAGLSRGTQQAAATAEQSSTKIAASFDFAAKAAVILAAVVAALTAANRVYAAQAAAVDAFVAQEQSQLALSHALRQTTTDTEAATAALREQADQLEALTGVSDEAIASAQAHAATMGFSADQVEALTATAAGLSVEFGLSMPDAMAKTIDAAHGNASALQGLIPEMRYAVTEAQRFDMVLEAAGRGMDAAAERTDTVAARMAAAGNATTDLSQTIGAILAPLYGVGAEAIATFAQTLSDELTPAIEFVTTAVESSRPLIDALLGGVHDAAVVVGVALESMLAVVSEVADALGLSRDAAESWADTVSAGMRWAAEQVISALTWAEVILTNLPAVLELVATAWELWTIGLVEDAKHALTVAVPAYLEYFTGISSEWIDAIIAGFAAAGDALLDILLAPWRALAEIAPAILDGINASIATTLAGWNATTAFAAAEIGKLPDVAARQLTEREQALQGAMSRIATDLTDEFDRKFAERVGRLGIEATEDMAQQVKEQIGNLERQRPRLGLDTTQLSAVEARFLTRGVTQDPLVGIDANTRRTAEATERLPEALAQAIGAGLQPRESVNLRLIE